MSAYRGLADHALASFQKGQRVIVTGSFKLREWESNGRQGTSAEIDAHSLGHDLLWGTTRFDRDDRTGRESSDRAPDGGNATADLRGHDEAPDSSADTGWGVGERGDGVPF